MHYIKKQNLELVFPSPDVADELWESLMDFQKQEGNAIIEEVFDSISNDESWIRVDALSIDLGRLSARSFRQEYLDQLRSSLEKALAAAIAKGDKVIQADQITVWETTIIHYLKFGTILWDTATGSSSLIKDLSAIRNLFEEKITDRLQSSISFRRILAQTLRQSDTAMQRWTRQFSTEFYDRIKKTLLTQADQRTSSFLNTSLNLIEAVVTHQRTSSGIHYQKTQRLKWDMLFSNATAFATNYLAAWISEYLQEQKLRDVVITILQKGNDENRSGVIEMLTAYPELFFRQTAQEKILPAALNETLIKVMHGLQSREGERTPADDKIKGNSKKMHTGKEPNDASEYERTAKIEVEKSDPGKLKEDNQFEKIEKIRIASDHDDGEIYIDNAGLVLLAPFIEPFFIQLGINTEINMADDADASLGVQLLQLLVTNSWDEDEHRLVLNKILCGRSPEWAGYRIHDIPVNAAKESDELLRSIIQYWDALKNTSPEAIQETFLQRQGKLQFRNEQWELWIEYKTQDILLDSIPWTFSVIKLPWMQHPLYVTW